MTDTFNEFEALMNADDFEVQMKAVLDVDGNREALDELTDLFNRLMEEGVDLNVLIAHCGWMIWVASVVRAARSKA